MPRVIPPRLLRARLVAARHGLDPRTILRALEVGPDAFRIDYAPRVRAALDEFRELEATKANASEDAAEVNQAPEANASEDAAE